MGYRHTPEAYLIDMDGVVYTGNRLMPGAGEFIFYLQEKEVPFLFLTNNASKTPEEYRERLASLGIHVSTDRIYTSALATTRYMSERWPKGTPVYVIGISGIRQALSESGFRILRNHKRAQAVVVGYDPHITYARLREATLAIYHGAAFIGTNPDVSLPTEDGIYPGNGAFLAALEAATGVSPTIIGKPSPTIFLEALDRLGTAPEKTAMIGDRVETDIVGAQNTGLLSVFLTGGVSGEEGLKRLDTPPDFVFRYLGDLLRWLKTFQKD